MKEITSELFSGSKNPEYLWLTVAFFLGSAFTLFYLSFLRANSRTKHILKSFPGPKTLPIIGNVCTFSVENYELIGVLKDLVRTHGKTFLVWLMNQPYVATSDAQIVEKLISSTQYNDKSCDYDLLHPWLGTGLLTSSGNKWHTRRKLLTPSFHFKILEDFADIFNEKSLILVKLLAAECADTGKVHDMWHWITRCALDIISESAMGKNMNAQMERDSQYVQSVCEMGDILVQRFRKPWLRINFLYNLFPIGRRQNQHLKVLHKFTEDVIKERKAERKLYKDYATQRSQEDGEFEGTKKKKRLAFMDLLLDASDDGRVLSDLDIREETDTFMFEGHDTTAAAINWALFLLGTNPDIQKRVQEELDDILGDEENVVIKTSETQRMKYLDCCIKETLRLYPSVPVFGRRVEKDLNLQDGLTIPKGTAAYVCAITLHRDPDVFPDPEKFDPDRFLPENCVGRNPFAYIPFSAGPRNCVGQKFAQLEEKIVLAQLLRHFTFEATEKVEDLKLVPDMILRSKNGLNFRVYKRNPVSH